MTVIVMNKESVVSQLFCEHGDCSRYVLQVNFRIYWAKFLDQIFMCFAASNTESSAFDKNIYRSIHKNPVLSFIKLETWKYSVAIVIDAGMTLFFCRGGFLRVCSTFDKCRNKLDKSRNMIDLVKSRLFRGCYSSDKAWYFQKYIPSLMYFISSTFRIFWVFSGFWKILVVSIETLY